MSEKYKVIGYEPQNYNIKGLEISGTRFYLAKPIDNGVKSIDVFINDQKLKGRKINLDDSFVCFKNRFGKYEMVF